MVGGGVSDEIFAFNKITAPPKILFAGDSLMQGVAPIAIADLKKIYPKGKYLDLSQQSTGLTVKRYFDWPQKIKAVSKKEGLNIIVIFLGPNDPWDIYENKRRYIFPSSEWKDLYQARVNEVLRFASQNNIHVIWIGLPNMGVERLKKGAIIQNAVFKEETRKYQFDYISTEDYLGSLNEPFKRFIQDPIKGAMMIRGTDGIHFTGYGYRLVSNQVVKAITAKIE